MLNSHDLRRLPAGSYIVYGTTFSFIFTKVGKTWHFVEPKSRYVRSTGRSEEEMANWHGLKLRVLSPLEVLARSLP